LNNIDHGVQRDLADDKLSMELMEKVRNLHLAKGDQQMVAKDPELKEPGVQGKVPRKATAKSSVHIGLQGIQYARADLWKQQHWHLLTHAGFPTSIHHDAAGVLSWVKVGTGMKIWEILQPLHSFEKEKEEDTLSAYSQMVQGTLSDPENAKDHFKGYLAFLEPGDIL
jgi:hypothetical protein